MRVENIRQTASVDGWDAPTMEVADMDPPIISEARASIEGAIGEKVIKLPNLGQALGLSSLEIRKTDGAEMMFDEESLEGVVGVSAVKKVDEDCVPESYSPELKRKLTRLHTTKAEVGINISSESGDVIEPRLAELVTLVRPVSAPPERLSPRMVTKMVSTLYPDKIADGVVLSGPAAKFPEDHQRITAEAIGNLVLQPATKGVLVNDLSKYAHGSKPSEKEVTMSPKDDASYPFTVLNNFGIFEKVKDGEQSPLVLEIEGDNITPAKICEILSNAGLKGPLVFQLVIVEGKTNVRAIHDFPKDDFEVPAGEMVGKLVSEHMAEKSFNGPAVATGLKTDTPYTENGHMHVISLDGTEGGHLVSVSGKVRVQINPLKEVVYGTYNTVKEAA